VYSFLYTFCRDRQEAEDLLHDTFLKAHRALLGGERLLEPRHWLLRVAYRTATDHWRRARLVRWLPIEGLRREPAVPSDSTSTDEREAIVAVLRRLPPDQRACLVLREGEDMPYAAIAATLGLSLGAVKMKLLRARERFRRLYTALADERDGGEERAP